jgi:hypothetical protein
MTNDFPTEVLQELERIAALPENEQIDAYRALHAKLEAILAESN